MHSSEETENIKMFFRQQHSFVNSKIIFTASELGVFDLLRESGEPLPSATVAERLKTSLTGMQILLQACVELKVLKVEWKEGKDLYGNTEFADLFLAKSSPKSQYYTMKFFSECAYLSLQYLPEAVSTNFNSRSKEGVENFFRYMDEAWSLHGKEVVSAFDLSGFQLICDLGGNCGLAKELISKYPNCTVKIFDLPEVVEISKKYNAFSEDSQITFHEGDFFKDPIPEADLYILSRVLFNWSDEKCIQLLTKVFTACKPGGGVLVVEPTIDKEISGSFPAHMYSILMLLHSEGKARSASEHCILFNTAGFTNIQFKKGNIFDVILVKK
uniref:Acetylserotonin O-methyltransferase n=1 Tax=Naja naja TaxID=35670 RepID=A0A8C6XA46_NAJNA